MTHQEKAKEMPKTTTTVTEFEYDSAGRLTKETKTVTETDQTPVEEKKTQAYWPYDLSPFLLNKPRFPYYGSMA